MRARLSIGAARPALAAAALVAAALVPLAGASGSEAGTLEVRAAFVMTSRIDDCDPRPYAATLCASRVGRAVVRGLGVVTERYEFPIVADPPGCGAGTFGIARHLATWSVAGRGELRLLVPATEECFPSALRVSHPPGAIVGGSGAYAGASGVVELTSNAGYAVGGSRGTDTWSGTLSVPGLEFDLAPPTLRGAVSRTLRAARGTSRIRVSFRVSARDAVDGAVPASCAPRSGSLFRLGRTPVVCRATDRSGNTASGRFTVTVRPR